MVLSLWQQRRWPEVERELDRIVARLRTLDPERVILFGSFARGDFHEGSDIDLMVILNTSERFIDRIGHVLEVLDPADFDVEPLVYTAAEYENMRQRRTTLIDAVEREGKVLYERSPGQQSL
jgi:predicted nucleotidyltransferase